MNNISIVHFISVKMILWSTETQNQFRVHKYVKYLVYTRYNINTKWDRSCTILKFLKFLCVIIRWHCNFLNFGKSFTYNENGYRTSCGPGPRVGLHCLPASPRQSSWISILEFTFFHDAPDAWNCFTVCWSRRNGWNTGWSWRKFLQKFKTSTSYCFLCSLLLSMFSLGRSNGTQIRKRMTH